MADFSLNGTFSFETLAPSLLGAKIKNAKLTGIFGYDIAVRFFNPNAQHANIFPVLPAGTSKDLTKYTYYEFKTENGSTLYLAKEWINLSTVTLVSGTTTRITIYDSTIDDQQKLRSYLLAAGYKQFTVEVI